MKKYYHELLHKVKELLLEAHYEYSKFYELVGDILRKELPLPHFHISISPNSRTHFTLQYQSDEERLLLGTQCTEQVVNFDSKTLVRYNPKLVYSYDELEKTISYTNNEVKFTSYQTIPIKYMQTTIGGIGIFHLSGKELSPIEYNTIQEITDFISIYYCQQNAEEQLLQQTSRLSAIFESTSDLIWYVNQQMDLVSFNQNYFQAIFYKYRGGIVSEYNKAGTSTSLPFDEFWQSKYQQVFKGTELHFEIELKHPDSSSVWKEIHLMPIFKANSTIDEICGIAHDISDKMKTVQALHQEEKKFKQIFDSFQDLYIRTDMKGYITMVSPSVCDILGYKPEDVLGSNINTYYHNIDTKAFFEQLMDQEVLKNIEISLIGNEGLIIPSISNIRIVKDNTGSPIAIENICRDITDIKKTNEALVTANNKLELSLKTKEQFLANMSHEIRTPMNGIIGLLDILIMSPVNSEQKKYLVTIKQSSKLLLSILNDILDLSKINASKLKLNISPLSIVSLIESTRLLFNSQLTKKNIQIATSIDKTLPRLINSDRFRLQQILSNLVSNAIKFTPKGGNISVTAKRIDDEYTQINVVDNGIGIQKEALRKLFTEFTQINDSFSKTFEGTGLGLTISMKLTRLLNGNIGVSSEYGKGSDFWFTFKMSPALDQLDDDTLEEETIVTDQPSDIGRGQHILVVDDNSINRLVASEILKTYGYEITEANGGEMTFNILEKMSFDVIFMDIQMPVIDGVQVMKSIKDESPDQIVIAMTAYDENKEANRFKKMGFDGSLIKPITPQSVLKVLSEISEILNLKKRSENLPGFNFETFNELNNVIGKKTLDTMLREFDKELAKKVSIMMSALKENNHKTIFFNAHSIKGDASTLGFEELTNIVSKIENDILNEQYSALDENLKSLYLKSESIPKIINNIISRFS